MGINMKSENGKISKLYMLSKNRKIWWLFLYLAGILIIFINISPCLATYHFEGVPLDNENSKLKEIESGTITGGLYVDAGKGKGLYATPYVEEFNVPGTSVKWARMYVGVWGGTEAKYGTLDLTVNGKEFDTVDLKGTADPEDEPGQNPAIYCNGKIIILAEQKSVQTTSGFPATTYYSKIATDYVQLLLK